MAVAGRDKPGHDEMIWEGPDKPGFSANFPGDPGIKPCMPAFQSSGPFRLELRLLGTADLVGKMVTSIPGGDITAVAVMLCVIGISAFVLDAFEIIFVIVPIVIPPLPIRIADARRVSVLVLLTLQPSFLLPPFGYALMMVRGVLKEPVAFRLFLRALWRASLRATTRDFRPRRCRTRNTTSASTR
jgi:tripartite ATP-independent transporter DctM subunit